MSLGSLLGDRYTYIYIGHEERITYNEENTSHFELKSEKKHTRIHVFRTKEVIFIFRHLFVS